MALFPFAIKIIESLYIIKTHEFDIKNDLNFHDI
jgi:hypothetical protein